MVFAQGDVANEVETEQVVEDTGVSSIESPKFSSFVQMRGSIPAHWSQGITKMVPKPAISFDLSDPFAQAAGMNFMFWCFFLYRCIQLFVFYILTKLVVNSKK